MPNYFHVSAINLNPGDFIEPGRWGQLNRLFGADARARLQDGGNAVNMIWETALETARQLCAPDSPSRLDCVFAMLEQAHAIEFRDRFRVGAGVYEVACSDEIPRHIGNYAAITNTPAGVPWLDYMPAQAISYWQDAPAGLAEVLIGGRTSVVARRA